MEKQVKIDDFSKCCMKSKIILFIQPVVDWIIVSLKMTPWQIHVTFSFITAMQILHTGQITKMLLEMNDSIS